MDQGGSTTMWIAGENPDRNGIVSNTYNVAPTSVPFGSNLFQLFICFVVAGARVATLLTSAEVPTITVDLLVKSFLRCLCKSSNKQLITCERTSTLCMFVS